MEFLTEDATYLAGSLGLLAAGLLIAVRVTQQGKFLVWALASLGLTLAVIAFEKVWVTDNEQIEEAVYGLGRSVAKSDIPGVFDKLTPDVQFATGGPTMSGEPTKVMIKGALSKATFDFLRITHLRANAGGQSRRGTAEFQVLAGGSYQASVNSLNFATHNSSWSLGLRETKPGVWKISRITPVNVPGGQAVIPSEGGSPAVSFPTRSGHNRPRPMPVGPAL